jgi:predicted metal-binding membrane protein
MNKRSRVAGLNLLGLGALAGLCLLGWLAIVWTAQNMAHPSVQLMMPPSAGWSSAQAFMVFAMWAVMMGAMMLPSAAPMIVAHQRMSGQIGRHAAFVAAYLVAWAGFSLMATTAQWGFQSAGQLSRMVVLQNDIWAGLLLVAIGVFQFTPLKTLCLSTCRTPIGFLMHDWRDGVGGAFVMGLRHGVYCIGCCWALMAALFVFGVMNIYAIAVLSTIVLVEKITPPRLFVAQLIGLACIVLGLWRLI